VFHDDAHPSFHVYDTAEKVGRISSAPPEPGRNARGGTVVDLGAYLAGVPVPVRGRDFLIISIILRGRFG
jgi:hypothetical protein